MRETPNLLLKLPDPTDYVLVEDLNENFTKIDTEIAKINDPDTGLKGQFTKHLDDDALIKHKANQISFAPTAGMQAKNVQDGLVEAFLLGNSRKQDVVDKLLLVDDSLPITHESTWSEVLDAISMIITGKKWATGELYATQTAVFTKDDGTTFNYYYLSKSLSFSPNFVVIVPTSTASSRFTMLLYDKVTTATDASVRILVSNGYPGTTVSSSVLTPFKLVAPAHNENGFLLPINLGSTASAPTSSFRFYAFE